MAIVWRPAPVRDPILVHTAEIARRLTRRYIFALAVLAVLATGALIGAEIVIFGQAGTSALINDAGRQRMLSQRAVLFASRLTSESAASEREDARTQLLAAVDRLQRTNAALSENKVGKRLYAEMSPALHNIYFDGPDAINPLLGKFVTAGRALAAKAAAAPVAADDPDLVLVNTLGPTRLLAALDRAVAQYVADGEAAIVEMLLFEIVVWLLGLVVLFGVAVLIFAPMVRRLREKLAEVRAATSALEESEERFALAAQGASVGIRDHFDLRTDEEYWSPQFYRLLGYEPDEVGAKRSTFQTLLHPDDRQRFNDAIVNYLEGHAPLRVDCRLQHKSRGYRWFRMTGQAKWSPEGAPRRLITSFMDVEDRKQAEQMKSEFISTVSHELRTPLTAIMGALGLMRSQAVGPLSEKAERLAAVARDNGDRLVRLINDLLDVEKMAAGKIVFDFEEENLGDLLAQAKDQNEPFAEQHGASIVVEPVDPNLVIEVDKVRFAQVMSNLLSNAAKYSPQGGQITIATARRDGTVRVSVSDHGPGIPEEFRHHIFQRFAQADATGRRGKGGSGLGLSITKAIVEAHGGEIGFDSKEGEGSTFHLDIPVCHAAALTTSAETDDTDVIGIPDAPIQRPRAARILRIGNEAAKCSLAYQSIGEFAEIKTVATGDEARQLLSRRAFDLVILDLCVPGADGQQLLSSLCESGRPIPRVLIYSEKEVSMANWPKRLRSLVKATVNKDTLRETMLDELRAREDSLATRFKKSA